MKISIRNAALASAAAFCLMVVACGGSSGGGGSTTPITLDAPANVSASDGAHSNKIAVTWTAVSGAKSYTVYRAEAADGTFDTVGTSTTASYDDATVTFQKDYYYKISTTSSTDTEGSQSALDSGYADSKGGITNLSASNGTAAAAITLTWGVDQTSGAYTYKVFRSDNGSDGTYTQIAEPTATSYEDTSSLVAGKLYFYKVQGISAKGTVGDMSNYDNGYIPFIAPTSLVATQGTDITKVALTWSVVTAAASYTVYRSTTDGSFSAALASASANSYDDTSAEEGLAQFYAVEAVSADGIPSAKSTSASGYKGVTRPINVTAASGKSFSQINVSWTAVAGASSYKIYRSVDSGAYSTTPISVSGASYADTDVVSGIIYKYKIAAVRNSNDSALSDESTAGSILAAAGTRTVTVNWAANREKAVNRTGGGYTVEYSKAADFGSGVLTKSVPYVSGAQAPTTTTLNFTNSQTGTWYIRVKAFSNIGGATSAASTAGTIVID